MPQRDKLHETVKRALQRAGWTVTHDPYSISFEGDQLFIDLAAEQLLAAEQPVGEKGNGGLLRCVRPFSAV